MYPLPNFKVRCEFRKSRSILFEQSVDEAKLLSSYRLDKRTGKDVHCFELDNSTFEQGKRLLGRVTHWAGTRWWLNDVEQRGSAFALVADPEHFFRERLAEGLDSVDPRVPKYSVNPMALTGLNIMRKKEGLPPLTKEDMARMQTEENRKKLGRLLALKDALEQLLNGSKNASLAEVRARLNAFDSTSAVNLWVALDSGLKVIATGDYMGVLKEAERQGVKAPTIWRVSEISRPNPRLLVSITRPQTEHLPGGQVQMRREMSLIQTCPDCKKDWKNSLEPVCPFCKTIIIEDLEKKQERRNSQGHEDK